MRSTTSRTRHGRLIPNSFSNVLALFMPPVYGRAGTRRLHHLAHTEP